MNENVVNIFLAIFLLAANAFYVAAEFALVKARGYRINTLAKRNRFGAKLTQRMLGNIEAYLACCQLGITMASLGLGWVGEPTVAALLHPVLAPFGMPESALHLVSFLTGFLLFSSLHIVIGEQVPKTLAIRRPEPVSLWVAYPLHASFMLFYPLNWLLNAASRAVLRLFRVGDVAHKEILSGPELENLVETSAEHGGIQEGQAEYIQNVFRFGELEVSDVMVHRTKMITLCADDTPEDIVNTVIASPVTRLPMWRDKPENIIGILHAKDLLRALHAVDGDASKIDISAPCQRALVRAGNPACVRAAQGIPPPQDAVRARGRRIWRGRRSRHARGHPGRNRRRHHRRARRRHARRAAAVGWLRQCRRRGADP